MLGTGKFSGMSAKSKSRPLWVVVEVFIRERPAPTCKQNLMRKEYEVINKENQKKRVKKMRKRKDTNFGNEVLDARICGEGTPGNLGIQH
jgi:hypothetical protein